MPEVQMGKSLYPIHPLTGKRLLPIPVAPHASAKPGDMGRP